MSYLSWWKRAHDVRPGSQAADRRAVCRRVLGRKDSRAVGWVTRRSYARQADAPFAASVSYRPTRSIVAALHHAAASLFLPVRRLAGPFHRGRPALSDEQVEKEHALPPLPRPWSLDDRWYRGDFPPRMHNDVCALIHGHEYCGSCGRAPFGAPARHHRGMDPDTPHGPGTAVGSGGVGPGGGLARRLDQRR